MPIIQAHDLKPSKGRDNSLTGEWTKNRKRDFKNEDFQNGDSDMWNRNEHKREYL